MSLGIEFIRITFHVFMEIVNWGLSTQFVELGSFLFDLVYVNQESS